MSTMLEEKICQFVHNLGDTTNSDWIIKKGPPTTSAYLSIKIILVEPNLVRTFSGNNFLMIFLMRTLENNYFLVHTKLGYLR